MEELTPETMFLVLEDDANDAMLIRRAFKNSFCRAFVCRNTSEARAYLVGAGMYEDRSRYPFPDIFVTDLRLNDESGVQFLKWIRHRPELKDLPVIVLSGAATPADIRTVTALGVEQILQKPANPLEIEGLVIKVVSQLLRRRPHKSNHSALAA